LDVASVNLSGSLLLWMFSGIAISWAGLLLGIGIVALLLICSALISSSEVAFFSLTASDFQKLEQESNRSSQDILALKDFPRRLLATILISNNFINIGIVILSDYIFRMALPVANFVAMMQRLPDYYLLFGMTREQLGKYTHFGITVIGVTFLLVLFGEVAPKVYAKLNNMKIARFMSRPLMFLSSLFKPFSNLLVSGTKIIERKLAHHTGVSSTSKEDIDQAIELTVKDEQQEIDILKGIVKFGEVSVKQIMCSRVDVVAVDFKTTFVELIEIIKESGYSRIPIFDEDFDNIMGVLYVKDLLKFLNEADDFEWQGNIRSEIHYVPEAKKISDLLKEFQSKRQHMAIVVDEYGGSSGIVTLEDIMEEVIGEIRDEFDDTIEVEFTKIDDFNFVFEGKTLLNDVCRIVGIDTGIFDDDKGDADSLAGLLLEIIGFIPKKGRVVYSGEYRLEVVSVNKRRVEQIKITLPKNMKKK